MYTYPSITLASQSPRRHSILEQLKIPHTITQSNIDEETSIAIPQERVMHLALQKATAVSGDVDTQLIIAADTIVALPFSQAFSQAFSQTHKTHETHKTAESYSIFEKPQSAKEATQMLTKLSGTTHTVYSAICVMDKHTHSVQYETSMVSFIPIEPTMMSKYIDSKEWQGVAGAYGIQGLGAMFIREIHGNYSNIMGLSIPLLIEMLSPYRML